MFEKFKQWAQGKRPTRRQDQLVLTRWAHSHGHVPKQVTGSAKGLVIEWSAFPARLEWGDSHRPGYIAGAELRWRADGLPDSDAQMVCMTKALVRRLETQEFDQISGNQQKTVIDTSMPDEVRWLAMLPKAHWEDRPALGAHFALLCRHEPLLGMMKSHAVCQALMAAENTWWTGDLPCVLMHNRGLLTLRMIGNDLAPELLTASLSLFEVMVQQFTQTLVLNK